MNRIALCFLCELNLTEFAIIEEHLHTNNTHLFTTSKYRAKRKQNKKIHKDMLDAIPVLFPLSYRGKIFSVHFCHNILIYSIVYGAQNYCML